MNPQEFFTADDLLFQQAHRRRPINLAKDITFPEIANVVHAFERNMTRVCALVDMAPELVYWTEQMHTAFDKARLNIFGTIDVPTKLNPKFDDFIKEHLRLMKLTSPQYDSQHGYELVNGLARMPNETVGHMVRTGIEAILASQIIGTWSSFEILASVCRKSRLFYSCQADKLGKFMLLGRAVVAPADI